MITSRQVQTALHLLFPPRCISCGDLVEDDFALCGPCWRGTTFISGAICDRCGTPLPGDGEDPGDDGLVCDDCMFVPRPWTQGRAVLVYEDRVRHLVMALKHGDRQDIAQPAGRWMARASHDLVGAQTLICPIPLHWTRLFRRRFNQSALLAQVIGKHLGLPVIPDLLIRRRATKPMEGMSRADRIDNLLDSIAINPKHQSALAGRDILLVDDVMTSGATFSVASKACLAGNASHVNVIALARVAKRP